MTDDLTRRLAAVERAVTDGETDLSGVADAADVAARLDAVEERLDAVETRLDGLDATAQALRGYLGGVDGVAEDVERRADLALSKAEAVEAAVFTDDGLAVERLPTTRSESVAGSGEGVGVTDVTDAIDATDTADLTPSTTSADSSSNTVSPTATVRDGSPASPHSSQDSCPPRPSPTTRDESSTLTSPSKDDDRNRSLLTRLRDAL